MPKNKSHLRPTVTRRTVEKSLIKSAKQARVIAAIRGEQRQKSLIYKSRRRILTNAVGGTLGSIGVLQLDKKEKALIHRAFQKHLNSKDGLVARTILESELEKIFGDREQAKLFIRLVESKYNNADAVLRELAPRHLQKS